MLKPITDIRVIDIIEESWNLNLVIFINWIKFTINPKIIVVVVAINTEFKPIYGIKDKITKRINLVIWIIVEVIKTFLA